KTPYCRHSVLRHSVISSLHPFFVSENDNALPAAMAAAAKKARRLQERRSCRPFTFANAEVAESIFRRRRWRLQYLLAVPAGSALRHLVIRWHLEKRRIRLRP